MCVCACLKSHPSAVSKLVIGDSITSSISRDAKIGSNCICNASMLTTECSSCEREPDSQDVRAHPTHDGRCGMIGLCQLHVYRCFTQRYDYSVLIRKFNMAHMIAASTIS